MYVMDPSTLDYIKYLGRYRVLVYVQYIICKCKGGSRVCVCIIITRACPLSKVCVSFISTREGPGSV